MTGEFQTSRRGRIAFALVFSLMVASVTSARERIQPLSVKAVFSRDPSVKPWFAFVHSGKGKRVYKLFFDEERDTRGTLIGVNFVLDDGQYSRSGLNLLSPEGNWHGLQPYMFVGRDFLNGVDKSGFGPHRTIKIERIGIIVRIDVLDVSVSPAPGGEIQVDGLTLSVSAENLNP